MNLCAIFSELYGQQKGRGGAKGSEVKSELRSIPSIDILEQRKERKRFIAILNFIYVLLSHTRDLKLKYGLYQIYFKEKKKCCKRNYGNVISSCVGIILRGLKFAL